MKQHFAVCLTPNQSDWQSAPQFTACRLVANSAVEAGAQHMEFSLRHGALESEYQPIIKHAGMIDTIGIADERIGGAAEVEQSIPIGVVARHSRDFQPKHNAHVSKGDLSGHVSEAGTLPQPGA